jgi:hypothetical protein
MRRGLTVVAGVVVAGLLVGGAQLWQGRRGQRRGGQAELPEIKAILTAMTWSCSNSFDPIVLIAMDLDARAY